ncbi:MAG TPA: hypothetical protein PLQ36_00015 [Candidatus Gracilibacteria bacterium]|nr:hypothetical protein [Candidatus Gracilibacteria bacterium]
MNNTKNNPKIGPTRDAERFVVGEGGAEVLNLFKIVLDLEDAELLPDNLENLKKDLLSLSTSSRIVKNAMQNHPYPIENVIFNLENTSDIVDNISENFLYELNEILIWATCQSRRNPQDKFEFWVRKVS